jgi:hypothetical protein
MFGGDIAAEGAAPLEEAVGEFKDHFGCLIAKTLRCPMLV